MNSKDALSRFLSQIDEQQFTLALRTDNANPTSDESGVVTGWSWPIHWLDILPPEYQPNSNFMVEHVFYSSCPWTVIEPVNTEDDVFFDGLQNRICQTNLAQRAVVTTAPNIYSDTTWAPKTQVPFMPGYLNTIRCEITSVTNNNEALLDPETPSTQTFCGRWVCDPKTFMCFAPEKHSAITISVGYSDLLLLNNSEDKHVFHAHAAYMGGVHVFKFKLLPKKLF